MHADDRMLVASGAESRAFAAAMSTAVSLVATWAAKHSLSINADSSGAALFCIASHRQYDEDTATIVWTVGTTCQTPPGASSRQCD
ncbi:hypothetical protein TcYC6_0104330 [Trypanosoma cruzi]|nr:hypothetical protein TcYC6_0104330 [Trypanosoma cruzi]